MALFSQVKQSTWGCGERVDRVRWLLYLTFFFVQQVAREQNLEKSLSNETLENDCSQILERRKLMNTVYNLRRELRRAEVLQDKVSGAVQIPAGGQWVIRADEAPAMSCLWSGGAAQQGSLLLLFYGPCYSPRKLLIF